MESAVCIYISLSAIWAPSLFGTNPAAAVVGLGESFGQPVLFCCVEGYASTYFWVPEFSWCRLSPNEKWDSGITPETVDFSTVNMCVACLCLTSEECQRGGGGNLVSTFFFVVVLGVLATRNTKGERRVAGSRAVDDVVDLVLHQHVTFIIFFSSLSLGNKCCRKWVWVTQSASVKERECSSTGESNEGGSAWRSVHCVYNTTPGRGEGGSPLVFVFAPNSHWRKKRVHCLAARSCWKYGSPLASGCRAVAVLGARVCCYFTPRRRSSCKSER